MFFVQKMELQMKMSLILRYTQISYTTSFQKNMIHWLLISEIQETENFTEETKTLPIKNLINCGMTQNKCYTIMVLIFN